MAMMMHCAAGIDDVYSGNCGDHCHWTVVIKSKTLTFHGWGAMNCASNSTFKRCGYLTMPCGGYIDTIIIENGITSIAYPAFNNIMATSVTIPDTVTFIDHGTFSGCSNLRSLTIPSSVAAIAGTRSSAFFGCKNLRFNEYDNAYYLGNSDNPYHALIMAKNQSITSCKIHENTKVIAGAAFAECPNLRSITIPDTFTSLGNYSFAGFSALQSITIPSSVTSIGSYAFYSCTSLESVNMTDSVTFIGNSAFYTCTALKTINVTDSVTYIGNHAFYWCKELLPFTIPKSISFIGQSSFSGCKGWNESSVIIPESVTYLGYGAFNNCSLQSVTLNNDYVVSVARNGFNIVREFIIGDSVKSISEDAFIFISSVLHFGYLQSVTIGSSVESIGETAFSGCYSLISVTIGKSVVSIGNSAFSNCKKLSEVWFLGLTDPNVPNVSTVFNGCEQLNEVMVSKKYLNSTFCGIPVRGPCKMSDCVECDGELACKTCSDGFYENEAGVCACKIEHCTTCSSDANECDDCVVPYYKDDSSGDCTSCEADNCAKCSGDGSCKTCSAGYNRTKQDFLFSFTSSNSIFVCENFLVHMQETRELNRRCCYLQNLPFFIYLFI